MQVVGQSAPDRLRAKKVVHDRVDHQVLVVGFRLSYAGSRIWTILD